MLLNQLDPHVHQVRYKIHELTLEPAIGVTNHKAWADLDFGTPPCQNRVYFRYNQNTERVREIDEARRSYQEHNSIIEVQNRMKELMRQENFYAIRYINKARNIGLKQVYASEIEY